MAANSARGPLLPPSAWPRWASTDALQVREQSPAVRRPLGAGHPRRAGRRATGGEGGEQVCAHDVESTGDTNKTTYIFYL